MYTLYQLKSTHASEDVIAKCVEGISFPALQLMNQSKDILRKTTENNFGINSFNKSSKNWKALTKFHSMVCTNDFIEILVSII